MKRKRLVSTRMGLRWPAAPALLAWLLPVFAWAPLAYPGYPELHSGFLPVFNLVDLLAHWRDWGWMPLIGQPFDLLRGEGFLPYALAVFFHLAGLSAGEAIKLVFAASLVAGSAGMYRWVRLRSGSWPALVAAVAYVYWPMGLATVLVRGALAEAVLLGLLPWVLYAAECLRGNGFSRSVRPGMAEAVTTKGRQSRVNLSSPYISGIFRTDAHVAAGASADENLTPGPSPARRGTPHPRPLSYEERDTSPPAPLLRGEGSCVPPPPPPSLRGKGAGGLGHPSQGRGPGG